MRAILSKLGSPRPAPHRFVILGLPRSGTTYLTTLLNAHPKMSCTGEQFNPRAVVGLDEQDDSYEAVVANRDADPVGFMQRIFEEPHPRTVKWAGFKFMLGHNISVFKALEADPDITLVYVWRENRLAQVTSLIKAAQSQRWAQGKEDSAYVQAKINASPRQISHRWHELAMTDYLFSSWLAAQPHRQISIEYRDMFAPGFNGRICEFFGLKEDRDMKSPLVKQGSNTILDRIEDQKAVRHYFNTIGYGRWLEDEL
ncbi:sulfotransferase family protein [Pelagimonas varians]|uniref:sulfotransferase family protein n=1 Tax=Pelagimonas varians TaxID=696760 RepID=UPI000D9091D0|nr:sulfotransferase [Pelagimonas varians]PYG26325.1 LPS sulfotransferase NodH [Pelagimonas varians]